VLEWPTLAVGSACGTRRPAVSGPPPQHHRLEPHQGQTPDHPTDASARQPAAPPPGPSKHQRRDNNERVSHQGLPGWFPECVICGMGNLPGAVCLNPLPEIHAQTPITDAHAMSAEIELDGHMWKRCLLCQTTMLADPAAWGSVAYCVDCWNRFARRGLHPPTTATQVRELSAEDWGTR
jgi:hypothetical protein